MSKSIEIEGRTFVPPVVAGKAVGFTNDYITRLAREGKVNAYRVGRGWFVDPGSLQHFIDSSATEKAARQARLRESRKRELAFKEEQRKRHRKRERDHEQALRRGRISALAQTSMVIVLGLMFAVGVRGFSVGQFAGPTYVGSNFLEEVAINLYLAINPFVRSEYWSSHQQTQQIATTSASATQQQRVVYDVTVHKATTTATTPVTSVKGAFSDDVSVTYDSEAHDSGVIVPTFRSGKGEAYRFHLAIDKATSSVSNPPTP